MSNPFQDKSKALMMSASDTRELYQIYLRTVQASPETLPERETLVYKGNVLLVSYTRYLLQFLAIKFQIEGELAALKLSPALLKTLIKEGQIKLEEISDEI